MQKDLDKLGEWPVENVLKINASNSKAVRFTRSRVKDPLDYSLANLLIPEASSCRYLGIILRSDLSWADQIDYMVGSVQGGTNNCVRRGAKESGHICTSYEQFELGNFGIA